MPSSYTSLSLAQHNNLKTHFKELYLSADHNKFFYWFRNLEDPVINEKYYLIKYLLRCLYCCPLHIIHH